MGHHIEVFIGPRAAFGGIFSAPPFVGFAELSANLIVTPLTHSVIDALGQEADAKLRIRAAGERLSRNGPVVFLTTDYFGGAGGKEACGWVDGGPVWAAREGDEVLFDPAARVSDDGFDEVVICTFGWDREDTGDAFGTLGLGAWRHTEDLAEEVRAPITAPLGIILAGGQATRMGGGDKSLLPLVGAPILGHVIDRLRPQVAGLALNANGDPERFAAFGLPVLPDSVAGFPGPLAGVLAGLDWAAEEGASHVVTAAADTPFFPGDLVPCLQAAAEGQGKPIALARTAGGRHPTFGLWPADLRDNLREALGNGLRKVVAWTDLHGTAYADFPSPRFDPFFNVNTPEDLAEAARLMESA
jgi:molybdopterin-guanine dinucleotide biosynthesis protein A